MKIENVSSQMDQLVKKISREQYNQHRHLLGEYNQDDIYELFYKQKVENYDEEYKFKNFVLMAISCVIMDLKDKVARKAKMLSRLASGVSDTGGSEIEIETVKHDGDYAEEGTTSKSSRFVKCVMPDVCFDDPDTDGVKMIDKHSPHYHTLRAMIRSKNAAQIKRIIKVHLRESGWNEEQIVSLDLDFIVRRVIHRQDKKNMK